MFVLERNMAERGYWSGLLDAFAVTPKDIKEGLLGIAGQHDPMQRSSLLSPAQLEALQRGEPVDPRAGQPSALRTLADLTPVGPLVDAWQASDRVDQPDPYASGRETGNVIRNIAMMGIPGSGAVKKPLTRAQFMRQYSQHVDYGGRDALTDVERLAKIREEGFRSGWLNTLPPYQGGEPQNVIDQRYAPRKGQTVYLVPKDSIEKIDKYSHKVRSGWKPASHEAVVASQDFPDMYEEYLRAYREAYGQTVK